MTKKNLFELEEWNSGKTLEKGVKQTERLKNQTGTIFVKQRILMRICGDVQGNMLQGMKQVCLINKFTKGSAIKEMILIFNCKNLSEKKEKKISKMRVLKFRPRVKKS